MDWGLRPSGTAAARLHSDLLELAAGQYRGRRFHRRKHSIVISALIANLAKSDGTQIRYQRGKEAYCGSDKPPAIGCEVMVRVVDSLESSNLIETKLGYFDRSRGCGAASLMRAKRPLARLLSDAILREEVNVALPENLRLVIARDFPRSIAESAEAQESRNTLSEYNQLLNSRKIQLPGRAPLVAQYLCRIFNRDWNHGGRFYRGTWQNMPSEERRLLSINDSPVVELDYGELHLRMLYADEGINPQGDAYQIDGFERRAMKTAALIAINAENFRSARNCLQQRANWGEIPKIPTPSETLNAFAEAHPQLRKHLWSGVGLRLQNRDSELAHHILSQTTARGILALPVHDSFIVAEKHEGFLRDAMRTVYLESVGFEPKISVKRRPGSLGPI